jgi:SAM-dependent methyltransferase/glycosyltransferase involved in cell wall biosynthesis
MRVLVFGTYDTATHPRVGIIAEGLRASGADVFECKAPLGFGTSERVAMLTKPWQVPRLLARLAHRWVQLARQVRRLPAPDVVVVGYLGHFDIHLARLCLPGVPIALDHLIGASDTAHDRRVTGGLRQAVLRGIDAAALRAADLIIVDTDEHLAALPVAHRDRGVVVPVGAPDAWLRAAAPWEAATRPAGAALRVVFFGLYTPLQGTPVIGEALRYLAGAPVEVTMVGHGQDEADTKRIAGDNPAVNWLDWLPADELPALVAGHDVCLGIFGTGRKALRVVPNKVFQGAAAGCAIVTSDTAPQRRTLGDAATFVAAGDSAALAATLLRLAGDPDELSGLRTAASRLARREFAPAQVVRPLVTRLRHLLDGRPAHRGTARLTAGGVSDSLAPLTPNAWLRVDAINRMMPTGITDVLEVGCGQGALGVRLAQRYRYLGLEPDPASYAVAEQRIARAGRGEVRNTHVAALNGERFDLVCAFEVLEHIEKDAEALAEWASRLRDNGWLMLSVPAHQGRYGPADELVGHFRRYDPDALCALLRGSGFEEIDMRQYGAPLGYLLEAVRNAIGRRRLAAATSASVAERTAASGRLLQPRSAVRAALTRWGTAPFRVAQRAFPHHGTGLVVRARLASVTAPAGSVTASAASVTAPAGSARSDRRAGPASR